MDLYGFDAGYRSAGVARLAGLDEAGRGPLAGPVVAAAVVFSPGTKIPRVRDSKTIPEHERNSLYIEILALAEDVSVGFGGVDDIERLNILGATKLAMKRALDGLAVRPELLLLDAVKLPDMAIPQEPLIKGDAKSASIAAASIVAKVVRDAIMCKYHEMYPAYGFDRHRGYGTAEHLLAIRTHGPCPQHRREFRGVREHLKLF